MNKSFINFPFPRTTSCKEQLLISYELIILLLNFSPFIRWENVIIGWQTNYKYCLSRKMAPSCNVRTIVMKPYWLTLARLLILFLISYLHKKGRFLPYSVEWKFPWGAHKFVCSLRFFFLSTIWWYT